MKKPLVALIVVLIAGLAVAGFVVASRDDSPTETTGSTTEHLNDNARTEETANPAEETEAEATDRVVISNFNFSPANITVKKGTTVTWTNEDSTGHTVTSDEDGPLDSDLLDRGESYTFTFDEVGTFPYFCEPHPEMRGTVVVTD